jgi:hypothetical protein
MGAVSATGGSHRQGSAAVDAPRKLSKDPMCPQWRDLGEDPGGFAHSSILIAIFTRINCIIFLTGINP